MSEVELLRCGKARRREEHPEHDWRAQWHDHVGYEPEIITVHCNGYRSYPDKIVAPFTDEQIEALNEWQHSNLVHPFTCPDGHLLEVKYTTGRWTCTEPTCDYTQDWAHRSMLFLPQNPLPPIPEPSTGCKTGWAGRPVGDVCDDCHHPLMAHSIEDRSISCGVCQVLDDIRKAASGSPD